MVDCKSDFLVRYWFRPAQIHALRKHQQDPGDLLDRHVRITLLLTIQQESFPRFRARSQVVCGKDMRLCKERFEHDIPHLMPDGIPVLIKNYVAIEMAI